MQLAHALVEAAHIVIRDRSQDLGYTCVHVYIYIYIYVHIHREREIERDR